MPGLVWRLFRGPYRIPFTNKSRIPDLSRRETGADSLGAVQGRSRHRAQRPAVAAGSWRRPPRGPALAHAHRDGLVWGPPPPRLASPRLTRGWLPVSSSMAPLASFMAHCSGFTAPSPAAAAMAPGGGGGAGDRGVGRVARRPEQRMRGSGRSPSHGPLGHTGLARAHFRLPRPRRALCAAGGRGGYGGRTSPITSARRCQEPASSTTDP